jgi:hypothetical protein
MSQNQHLDPTAASGYVTWSAGSTDTHPGEHGMRYIAVLRCPSRGIGPTTSRVCDLLLKAFPPPWAVLPGNGRVVDPGWPYVPVQRKKQRKQ